MRKWREEWGNSIRDPSLTALLGLEVAFIFVAAPLASLGIAFPLILAGALVIALILVVVMLSQSVGAALLLIVSTVFAAADVALRLAGPSQPMKWLGHGAAIVALVALSVVVARAVFWPGQVTFHRIRGAIVLYLNVALTFSSAFSLIADLDSQSFRNLPLGQNNMEAISAMVYFSFTTLTTTGFGDIVPVHPIARSLANLEAIIGQLYPATLLARLVTLQLEQRRP